ncbi:beta-lactamase family protein, partial [candidate division KSB1 bacterium]
MKVLKIFACALTILLVLILALIGWYLYKAVPVGTGYVAKYLCTAAFVAERDPDVVFKEIKPINPLAHIIRWEVDRENGLVTASALGKRDTAIYRRECGCTLARDATVNELRLQTFFQHDRPDEVVTLSAEPWPLDDGPAEDAALYGIDPQQLSVALNAAFFEPNEDVGRNTQAVLVVYDGHLIAERYAGGLNQDQPLQGWSMAKSVTNALVGVQVQKGWLSLTDRPVSEWAPGDPRHDITLDQLLRMSSGMAFQENYAPLYDATNMLYKSGDFAAYAAGKTLAHVPDSVWSYSSGTANIVARIVRQQAERVYEHYYQ